MPLTQPHFSNVTSEATCQIDPPNMSDSDMFRFDPTIRTLRTTSQTFNHYELLEQLGEGQFGTVWRAKDQRLDRIVALKLPHLADFDERRRSLFLREARATAILEHPHIVQVFGVEQDGEQPGIVSQFIEGRTLSELIVSGRPVFEETARILAIVADAVHHAHEAGVIHRDLKPSNILLDNEGQPHVSDFGLAKWSGDQALLTNPGVVVGTPAYMSPEQARGDSHLVDRRSDVYSLGVLLYELMTGKPPFEGNSTLLLHQIQSQDPRAPRSHNQSIPLDLETICLKCLAKSPDERYATAHELADDLRRFVANEPISARSIHFVERSLRWTRRNPMVAALVAVSILSTFSAIGLGASLLTQPHASPKLPALPVVKVPVHPLEVSLNTEPEGATVVFYPLDPATGEPILSQAVRPTEKSPVKVSLQPSDYLVVTALPDGRFHEVYRHVPRDVGMEQSIYPHCSWSVKSPIALSLHSVKIPPLQNELEMSLLADSTLGHENAKARLLRPFFLDQREVKIGETLPIFGNRLPPMLNGRKDLLQSLDLPVTGLLFDEAMTVAEYSGKRLPTATEYEFAATNGWTTLFPWGDTEPPSEAWQLTAQNKPFDVTPTKTPIYGLFSNASEFVISGWQQPDHEPASKFLKICPEILCPLVRGGPPFGAVDLADLKLQGPRWQITCSRFFFNPHVGFRCAKSKSPRL